MKHNLQKRGSDSLAKLIEIGRTSHETDGYTDGGTQVYNSHLFLGRQLLLEEFELPKRKSANHS